MYKRYADVYGYRKKNKKIIWFGVAIVLAILLFGLAAMKGMAWNGGVEEAEGASVAEMSVLSATDTAQVINVKAQKIETGTERAQVFVPDKNCVVLDPGHGGYDVGSSNGNILEKNINLQISLKLRDKLEDMGYEVIMTREDDTHVSLDERVAIANDSDADIFVSIHQNSFEEDYVKGLETWYSSGRQSEWLYRSAAVGDDSLRLAQLLHYDMVSGTKGNDRGVRNGELWVTSMTKMPSCLVEPGFISNNEECRKLTGTKYQTQIVESLAEGIERYFDTQNMHLVLENVSITENTTTILDILKERNVKAFFWVKAETVREQPRAVERLLKEGHEIGLYCDVPAYNITYSGMQHVLTDFEAAYKTIYEMTGVKVKLFTFPDDSVSDTGSGRLLNQENKSHIISAMTARGFVYSEKNECVTTNIGEEDAEILIQNSRENEKIVMPVRVDACGVEQCLDEMLDRYPQCKFDILNEDMENISVSVREEKSGEENVGDAAAETEEDSAPEKKNEKNMSKK